MRLGIILVAPAMAWAQASTPAPRTDHNSMVAHEQLLEKKTKGTIDLYFEGDSIARRWGATDYPDFLVNWNRNFHGWNAADFGWGADKVENILWRLEHGELDDVNPKVIVLLAGTNNVGAGGEIADISDGLQTVISTMRAKAPRAISAIVRASRACGPTLLVPARTTTIFGFTPSSSPCSRRHRMFCVRSAPQPKFAAFHPKKFWFQLASSSG